MTDKSDNDSADSPGIEAITEISQLEQVERDRINAETAKIHWKELQRYFAAGKVFQVSGDLDLIETALRVSLDDVEQVRQWQQQGGLVTVSDTQAQEWIAKDAEVWAVVVKPLILVQAVE